MNQSWRPSAIFLSPLGASLLSPALHGHHQILAYPQVDLRLHLMDCHRLRTRTAQLESARRVVEMDRHLIGRECLADAMTRACGKRDIGIAVRARNGLRRESLRSKLFRVAPMMWMT